jgi:hypothetical protein
VSLFELNAWEDERLVITKKLYKKRERKEGSYKRKKENK